VRISVWAIANAARKANDVTKNEVRINAGFILFSFQIKPKIIVFSKVRHQAAMMTYTIASIFLMHASNYVNSGM
jgi:hypothetical protein